MRPLPLERSPAADHTQAGHNSGLADCCWLQGPRDEWSLNQLRVGQPLVGVLVPFLAADVGFVTLDEAAQFSQVPTAARFAEPMEHEPGGLLGDANFLGELHRADALAGRHQQIHGVEPLVQGDMAAFHDRARANREVLATEVTAVVTALPDSDPLARLTDRADDAIRPQARLQVDAGGFLIWKPLEQLECADGALGHKSYSC